jgi:hypothetical protein
LDRGYDSTRRAASAALLRHVPGIARDLARLGKHHKPRQAGNTPHRAQERHHRLAPRNVVDRWQRLVERRNAAADDERKAVEFALAADRQVEAMLLHARRRRVDGGRR